jgi:hypothetical protein
MPGIPKAKVKSRIVLTPQHAKRHKSNWENIHRFEVAHGEIKTEQAPIPLNFGPQDKHNILKAQKWSHGLNLSSVV